MRGGGVRAGVWYSDRRVGILTERDQRIQFTYDQEWLNAGGFPISLSLDFDLRPLDAHDFFAGLLPEGRARQRVCREFRLEESDDFGLLLAIGRDCAGALSVLPDAETPQPAQATPLTATDLEILVESHGVALPDASDTQRFSLAGAQDKVAVLVTPRGMWLPEPTRPSTHILKFETHTRVCLAEFLATDLARRFGLRVVAMEYRQLDSGTPYLLVERYDRLSDGLGAHYRLHQEDFTQALGVSSAQKYEEHGGPALDRLAELLRERSAKPVEDIASLRDWQLYNYLIGNYDGHAKNVSLLYPAGGCTPCLAPFYDLVCLEFLYRINIKYARKMAFSIDHKFTPEEVGRRNWEAFAVKLGLPARRVLQRLRLMAERLPSLAHETRAAWAMRYGDNQVLDRFEEAVADRCRWTLNVVK